MHIIAIVPLAKCERACWKDVSYAADGASKVFRALGAFVEEIDVGCLCLCTERFDGVIDFARDALLRVRHDLCGLLPAVKARVV